MDQQIKDAIAKVVTENLPAQMGSAFTTFFAKAQENERIVENQKSSIASQALRLNDYAEKERLYDNTEQRIAEVTKRENEVKVKEDRLTITLLEMRLAASEARAVEISGFVSNLLRNTEFRRTVSEARYAQTHYSGGQEHVLDGGGNKEETTKVE